MMTIKVTGDLQVGLINKHEVELIFTEPDGGTTALTFPSARLHELSLSAAQIAARHSAAIQTENNPPFLPVEEVKTGHSPDGGLVALRLEIRQGGAFGFQFSRDLASGLLTALQDALNLKSERPGQMN